MGTPAQTLLADRQRFPGLLPREILVLRAWLKLHEGEYDSFDFNVRLGQGHDPGPTWADNLRRMAVMNTQKRVDAVAYKAGVPTLIEVKDRAGFSAVGQLVGYDALWRDSHPTEQPPKLMMVCNRYPADLLAVLARSNIELAVVEVDFGILRRS